MALTVACAHGFALSSVAGAQRRQQLSTLLPLPFFLLVG